jgi:hypothetical protein
MNTMQIQLQLQLHKLILIKIKFLDQNRESFLFVVAGIFLMLLRNRDIPALTTELSQLRAAR